MSDWIDDLFDEGYRLDWKEQSYYLYLIEDSTMDDDEKDHYKRLIINNIMTKAELDVFYGRMVRLNRKTPMERPNQSATEINEIIKNKLEDENE